MATADDAAPAVGYGKPPPGRRFEKGVSGNPAGRPKKVGAIGLDTHIALSETVEIKENGVRRKITKRKAAAKQLANRGASGDLQAIKLISALERQDAASAPVDAALTVDEAEIAERLIARLRQGWRRIDDGAA